VSTRILAIDPGKVRLGLAISDPDRRIGSPLTTYTRKTLEADAVFLKRLVEEERVGALLVGLPVRMDGHEGEQAKLARVFGTQLESWTGLAVRFWDERYTSMHADTLMAGAGLSRAKQKERRDRVAAQILLQSFLDAGCPAENANEPEA
jgi:putative Holliday junction resolvase